MSSEEKEKPRYLFVLGRDWRASLLEIDYFLRFFKFNGCVLDYSSTTATVEFAAELPAKQEEYLMQHLGGTQKLARVYGDIPRDVFDSAFPVDLDDQSAFQFARRELARVLKDVLIQKVFPTNYFQKMKVFVANSFYPEHFDNDTYRETIKYIIGFLNTTVEELLQKELESNVTYFSYPRENLESGNLNPIFPHHVIRYELLDPLKGRAEVIYALTQDSLYIARTRAVTDPNFFKEVDEKRPVKHFYASIPPKVARMMLTFALSGQKGSTHRVLDPFCGTGTVLMMALYLNEAVYGSDASADMIHATEKNLLWFSDQYQEHKLKLGTDRIVRMPVKDLHKVFSPSYFDAIVTEPILLPYYQEPPSSRAAQQEFEIIVSPTYRDAFTVFPEILKPRGRVVIVTPLLATRGGKPLRLDVPGLLVDSPLKIVPPLKKNRLPPREDRRLQFRHTRDEVSILIRQKGDVVSREIWLLEMHK